MSQNDLTKCYGKKRICPDRESCELGECCLSAANEEADGIHFHRSHITEDNILDSIGLPESEEFIFEFDEPEKQDNVFNVDSEVLQKLDGDMRAEVLDVVRELALLYFNCPNSFDVLLRKIFKNENQSDIAREKSLSRQCVNQRLHRELGIGKRRDAYIQKENEELKELKERDSFLQSLSTRDFQIYRVRFIDGCTAEATAKIIGCDIRTVFRVTHFLRKNLNLSCHKNGRPRKEKTKNAKRN